MTVHLICDSCDRELDVSDTTYKQKLEESSYEYIECNECSGNLVPQDETEEDEFECDECEESYPMTKCALKFQESENTYCEKCVKHNFKAATNIEYKEKIVEKIVKEPVYIDRQTNEEIGKVSFAQKTRFD